MYSETPTTNAVVFSANVHTLSTPIHSPICLAARTIVTKPIKPLRQIMLRFISAILSFVILASSPLGKPNVSNG